MDNGSEKAMHRDCIITAAYGVGPDYVRTFLRTFRAVNTSARIILMVNHLRPLQAIAAENKAEQHLNKWLCRVMPVVALKHKRQRLKLTELISRTNDLMPRLGRVLPEAWIELFSSVIVGRHFHARRILRQNTFRQVLLCDCRDVLFQADPFASPGPFEVAEEDRMIGRCPYNTKWLKRGLGDAIAADLAEHHAVCAGTILGPHEDVLSHLDRLISMVGKARSWRPFGLDQAIHNYLVHRVLRFTDYVVSSNERGRIATVSADADYRFCDGYVVDASGAPFPIVHQYDRLAAQVYRNLKVLAERQNEPVPGF